MEFRQLEAFVNAVKYKSFSRAADVMFFDPADSKHPRGEFGERAGGEAF